MLFLSRFLQGSLFSNIFVLTLPWTLLSPPASVAAENSLPKTEPVVIMAGPDWIPLRPELDIEAGSALDFSHMPWLDAPAGKHGRSEERRVGKEGRSRWS